MRTPLLGTAFMVVITAAAVAQPKTYDFRDPKRVNTVSFIADSALEPIVGIAGDVRGTLTFDPEAPMKTTGTITVKARSVHVANKLMKEKLHGAEWLGVEEHRNIKLTIKSIKSARRPASAKEGVAPRPRFPFIAVGTFSLKGVEKPIEVPIRFTHLPGKLAERSHYLVGDLLVVRAEFAVDRLVFGVGKPYPVVAPQVLVRVAIVGYHGKPAPQKEGR